MRSAPFGLFAKPWVRPEHAAGLAAECSRLTHGHPTAAHASAALAWTVRELADGRPLREAVAAAQAYLDAAGPDAAETATALRSATAPGAGVPQPEEVEALGGGWIAEEALAIAVRCALAAEDGGPASVRAALLASVNHGGDSDSTGSLCGQLLGAAFGDQALPPEWVVEVEARGVLLQLADDLFYEVTRSEDLHGDHGPHTRWLLRYPGY
jgi:ADP-ribosylglycohydrolase